ncbi:tryptophan-rich antigen (Pv-fam-a) [Plasmodium ovale curtisi]|uniref:Tryptophan-rich antigen (Pv-fam-a) n=1 Tax=Plasmodium ovale curtisi TaxID=864141 RepID=A0A1A8VYY3_PLAOA|nr:tryptophan-rich antigen (Pv-fam-a) [Plasmodium ovale curtisi]
MEDSGLDAGKISPTDVASPILSGGLNVGRTLIGNIDMRTFVNILFTTSCFLLYKAYRSFERRKLSHRENDEEIFYDALDTQDVIETPQQTIQKQLDKIEKHNIKVNAIQNWLKDVEKRVKEETQKIENATGRNRTPETTKPEEKLLQEKEKSEMEILLEEGSNEKEVIEIGVDKIQKGLKIMEDLMEQIDNGAGKVPTDNIGSYHYEIEIPEDKIGEFDEGLELFQEGVRLIQSRVISHSGEDAIDEIKVEFEEQGNVKDAEGEEDEDEEVQEEEEADDSPSTSYYRDFKEEPFFMTKEGKYANKMMQVSNWIKEVDKMIKKEADKIKEEIEADVKMRAQYIPEDEERESIEPSDEEVLEAEPMEFAATETEITASYTPLTNEWKINEWNKWMGHMEIEWKDFLISMENHKKKWIEKKENEWDEWLTNLHYNWIGFTNKLEGEFVNNKKSFWTKWNEMDWKGLLEMDWKRHMKLKWTKLVKANDLLWKDKVKTYFEKWKQTKLNEWKSQDWKCEEYGMWINSGKKEDSNSNNNENWLEWKKRLFKEKSDWEKWTNEKEKLLIESKWSQWEKWKEYKWTYLNEWMKRIETEWLNDKPWELWIHARNKFYESDAKLESDVSDSDEEGSYYC